MKNRILSLLCAFVLVQTASALQYTTYDLYPNGMPDANCWTAADEADSAGRWLRVAVPKLLVSTPSTTAKGTVLIVPGGGYSSIAYQTEGIAVAEWLLSQGYATAILKYRMPCGNPVIPFEDACQAMKMLRTNATSWGLPKKKAFGAMGFSAGGHLVGALATKYPNRDARPDWCLLGYPVVSMEDSTNSRNHLLGDSPSANLRETWSIDKQVKASSSPMFIAVAQDDQIVKIDHSLLMYRALLPMGVYSEILVMPTGDHGFGNGENLKQRDAFRSALLQFIGSIDITKDKAQEINILPTAAVAKVTGNRWTVKEKNIIVAGSPEQGYKVYFAARTFDDGEELYVSDGESVAKMVMNLAPDNEGSDIKWLSRFNDKAVMQALNKLYISDGNTMTEIKDDQGQSLVNPMGFTQINEQAFIFTATENEKNALYICDGIAAHKIYDEKNEAGFSCVFPGEFHASDLNSPWCRVGRKVYFKAQTNASGLEVWVTNGTTEGTHLLKDINVGTGSSAPSFFYNVDNKYFIFKAWVPGLSNRMWYSDGTEAGTKVFLCEDCGTGDNAPNSNMALFKGKVYTMLPHRDKGKELFAMDPSTGEITFAKDFASGSADGNPNVFGEFDGNLWMEATESGVQYLYRTGNGKNFFRCDTWTNCFYENGYAVVNGTFYGYGLPSGGSNWGIYRFDDTDSNSERTMVHNGVACGTSSDGIPVGYSMRNAGGKLVYAVTTGDWANAASNQGVFAYIYCKEDGEAENLEPDFGPEEPSSLITPSQHKSNRKTLRNQQLVIWHDGQNYTVIGTPIK